MDPCIPWPQLSRGWRNWISSHWSTVDVGVTSSTRDASCCPELSSFFVLNTDGPTRGHSLKLSKTRRQILRTVVTLSTRVINDWKRLPSSAIDANSEASFKFTLSLRAVNLWNALPANVVEEDNEEQFKSGLNRYLRGMWAREFV